MTYSELLEKLNAEKEEGFARFQRKLISTKQPILGVRTPILRKITKAYSGDVETLLSFPDEYFEVTFVKLAVVSALPYERFINYLEECVARIDNWGTCDCFKAKCILKRKDDFLPVLEKLFENDGEYYKRYVLVTLLSAYVEERYLPVIEDFIKRTDTQAYYVHMAVAWLTAEILVKHYEFGLNLLKKGILQAKTHNKAIQKAIESYRLTNEQKEYLRSLKIKTNK